MRSSAAHQSRSHCPPAEVLQARALRQCSSRRAREVDSHLASCPACARIFSASMGIQQAFSSLAQLAPLASAGALAPDESSLLLREESEAQPAAPADSIVLPLETFLHFGAIVDIQRLAGSAPSLLSEPGPQNGWNRSSDPCFIRLALLPADDDTFALEMAGPLESCSGLTISLFPKGLPEKARQIEFSRQDLKWTAHLGKIKPGLHTCYLFPRFQPGVPAL